MKKRYIFLAIAAVEIATLPAAAHMVGGIDFSMPSLVAATELNSAIPGQAIYLVSSDGPFAITAQNAPGVHEIQVYENGSINQTEFGANAQMPGTPYACSQVGENLKTVIYDAPEGTELRDGEIISQAVLVTINYDQAFKPKFKFISDRKAEKLSRAKGCPALS